MCVDDDEVMKQGNGAVNVNCFITAIYYSDFNASSALLFKRKIIA
jgi:hypothetical protein